MTPMPYCPSPSQAVVDLAAIVHNLGQVREQAGGRQVMFAVKGDGYGHGASQCALEAQRTNAADWFAVANVAEGQELIAAGITRPILKLSPALPHDLDAAVTSGMRLTVTDDTNIAVTGRSARRLARTVKVHIGVDTGMGRIGLPAGELLRLADLVDREPNLELEGVFTHLPLADTPDGEDFTTHQIEDFLAAVERTATSRGPIAQVHVANSGAVLGHDLGATTMVRTGIAAYGYDPNPSLQRANLRPALAWRSWVSFVKQVAPGTNIGYGRTWTAERSTTIATIPVGYADGFPRLLSNRGVVLLGGRRCPVVGRVCMDQIMVDVGPHAGTKVGDEAVLIGSQSGETITADDMAAAAETISYEITSGLTARVDRYWVNASQ